MTFLIVFLLLALVDYYLYQAVLTATHSLGAPWQRSLRVLFWVPTAVTFLFLLWWTVGDPYSLGTGLRNWMVTAIVGIYFSKFIGIVFLFIDDAVRGVRWAIRQIGSSGTATLPGEPISRSEFLSRAALVATAVPFGTMTFGILSGAHDYRIRKVKVTLPNLPPAFHGIRMVQLSDIHSGSFWNKKAVQGGVEMVMREKPDVIFFTGDLVNNEAEEIKDYIPVFQKLRAPLGVFSVTGNHDYGDYRAWDSPEAKQQNFADLVEAHRLLGFDLLLNEHRLLQVGADRLAILGNENWGAGRFSKYGKLAEAYAGIEELPVKILLSHDPSHWDAQVRSQYPDIDLMLAGHTHGFQFGVEIGSFKWSPSQYAYKQWAGLYTQGNQHLYVNRGFGYIGYPGRIGMPPEITVLELSRT